ncbi:hypothetical protein [Sporosarcina sp. YIM B06819]|uniref:hypothetical protein n=1 Tax=Sporosarcina sp. YIM B06819 TaxID=3081769 RepID=UPI00298C4DAF|nr:hypothetical protein [Sporosarcina sp. YIM B06819]
MEQGQIERDRLRLINAERVVLELYLLVYPLYFVTGASVIGDHYLWLFLATVLGAIAYGVFPENEFSIGKAILIAAMVAVLFLILGYPFIIIFLLFVYVFWRLQANFSESKSTGWPYHVLNTILFTSFYLFTLPFYVNYNPYDLAKVHITLYLLTTVLYFVVHFAVIGMMGRHLRNFYIVDMVIIFGGLLGAGFVFFVAIFYLLEPLRKGIIAAAGFLFGGLFMVISKWIVAPIWDWIIAWLDAQRAQFVVEEESGPVDFKMQDEWKVYGSTSSVPDIVAVILMVSLLLIVFIVIIRKRKKMIANGSDSFFFRSGRRQNNLAGQSVYDYSVAVDAVRQAFKEFEQAAQVSRVPRLRGETVKEWFLRMDWGHNEGLFTTYDKVRYGSHDVTKDESNYFFDELEKIKNKYFSKDV